MLGWRLSGVSLAWPWCAIMPGVPLTPEELLTTTRSVRKRLELTRPVPLDLVQECLEIALQALPLVFELGTLAQHQLAHFGELRLVLVELALQRVDIGHHRVIRIGGAGVRPLSRGWVHVLHPSSGTCAGFHARN